jgi:hypothetical protein
MHRAARVLELEGYAVSPGNDNLLWGNMGPHHAVIICTPAPGGLDSGQHRGGLASP